MTMVGDRDRRDDTAARRRDAVQRITVDRAISDLTAASEGLMAVVERLQSELDKGDPR